MPYTILRFKKDKGGAIAGCERHNERKKEAYKSNPDIDITEKVFDNLKRAATKLANDLKDQGININPWYCEMEIYDKLRYFSK